MLQKKVIFQEESCNKYYHEQNNYENFSVTVFKSTVPSLSYFHLSSKPIVYLFSQQKSSHHKVAVSIKSNAWIVFKFSLNDKKIQWPCKKKSASLTQKFLFLMRKFLVRWCVKDHDYMHFVQYSKPLNSAIFWNKDKSQFSNPLSFIYQGLFLRYLWSQNFFALYQGSHYSRFTIL